MSRLAIPLTRLFWLILKNRYDSFAWHASPPPNKNSVYVPNLKQYLGITIEGLQEFHDEACLATLNNKYNDGIAWHDVACHFR